MLEPTDLVVEFRFRSFLILLIFVLIDSLVLKDLRQAVQQLLLSLHQKIWAKLGVARDLIKSSLSLDDLKSKFRLEPGRVSVSMYPHS